MESDGNIQFHQLIELSFLIHIDQIKLEYLEMQHDKLTDNAIEKILKDVNYCIVQVLAVNSNVKNSKQYFTADLSDGYSMLKNCFFLIDQAEKSHSSQIIEFSIIQLQSCIIQPNKKKGPPQIIADRYKVINNEVKIRIGNPMDHEEFIRKGKINNQGDNMIPKTNKTSRPLNPPEKKVAHSKLKLEDEESKIDQDDPFNSNLSRKQISNQSKNESNQIKSKSLPPEPKPKSGPIVKVQKKDQVRNQGNAKIQTKKNHSDHTNIKDLFVGIENWTIMIRVLFVSPLKTIMTKKGKEQTLMVIDVIDHSGMIQCNLYGETAIKFQHTFKEDQLYEISNGQIVENSFMQKKQIKINLSEQTIVNIKDEDPNIPYSEDVCINVKQLTQKSVGEEAIVICLVKDTQEVVEFTSKQGKDLKKKLIFLCDPQNSVEIEVTLWGETTELKFEKYPYMIRSIEVGEYNSNKQYKLKNQFQIRIMKQHGLRKYIKDMDTIKFDHLGSNQKNNKTQIHSFHDVLNTMEDDQNKSGIWSEVICYFSSIRYNTKNCYLSCPHCKKKVEEEGDSTCLKCNTYYKEGRYRYLLNVNLADYTGELWATAFDEVAVKLLAINGIDFTANQYARLTEQEIKDRVRKVKLSEYKMRLVTKDQEYMGTTRKKTNILKILPLDYSAETKTLLEIFESLEK